MSTENILDFSFDQDAVLADFPQRSVLDGIGHTPLVALNRLFPQKHITVYAKLEFQNPTGSIKDRIARYMLNKAEREGRLKPGATIIEASSGNTATAISMVAAVKGYKAILVMPAKASREKQASAAALGAQVIVCSADESYVEKAVEIARNIPGAFLLDQYNNPDNVEAHFTETGPEIWADVRGRIDYFVAGASTGGTVSGVGRYLKSKNAGVKIIVPDPIGSVYEPYHRTGQISKPAIKYFVEGIGKDTLVDCMDFSLVDQFLTFTDQQAFAAARQLAREEGIFAGGSSGANIWACAQLISQIEKPCTIVTVLPDSGFKYLSTVFAEDGRAD
jgi:cystathionine beta-synthase/cysteine synthase A